MNNKKLQTLNRQRPVLILDSRTPQAVVAIRSLGRKGLKVIAAESFTNNYGFRSRFAWQKYCYPDAISEQGDFIKSLIDCVKKWDVGLIMPMTDRTLIPIDIHRDNFEHIVKLAIPSSRALELARNKTETYKIALKLGIPVPQYYYAENTCHALEMASKMQYPLVIKPTKSLNIESGKLLVVQYACNEQELRKIMEMLSGSESVLLQELIQGEGIGIEVIAKNGNIFAKFQHVRVRELPITGGASSLRVSAALHTEAMEYTARLIKALKWDGVAMVEFKLDKNNTPFLMEINGRFWGSLALPVYSGIDFPYLQFLLFTEGYAEMQNSFRIGVKSRYLSRDIHWIEEVLRGGADQKIVRRIKKKKALLALFKCWGRELYYDLQSWDDPGPGIMEIGQIFIQYFKRLRKVLTRQ